MSQELATSGDQLGASLDRYARACSRSRDAVLRGGRLNSDPDLVESLKKQSDDIMSHIQKLEDARAMIQTARSGIPSMAPITTLSAEILACIFRLATPGRSCVVQRGYLGIISQIQFPLYPDALAQVCSFWRHVAITTPSLWTHIDIALDHSLNPGLFARAKAYVARAAQLPLEIHISDPGSERENQYSLDMRRDAITRNGISEPPQEWDDLHDFKIFSSDIVPIKSLEMDLKVHIRFREIYFSLLEYFFARCKPGVLTKYSVRSSHSCWANSNPFVEPADTPHSLDGALLGVPIAHLNEVWLHISSIRVSGLCPHWKTKAYFGLVELYIDEGIPEISGPQLIDILRSSPKLQVFHMKAQLDEFTDDELAHDQNVNPVLLEDLRELTLTIRGDDGEACASYILRRITPGSKPLQLSALNAPGGAIAEFFSRANVTRFYVWGLHDLTSILGKSSGLEILVVDQRDLCLNDLGLFLDEYDDGDDPSEEVTPTVQIHTLYLLGFLELIFEEIQAIVKKYSVQRLLIYYGALSYQADDGRVVSNNSRNIRAKLSTITSCPTIEYHSNSYPTEYYEGEACDPTGWIREAVRS